MQHNDEIRTKVNNYLKPETPYAGETKVLHYLEVLRDEIGWDNVRKAVVKPLTGRKIGAYYGCMLLRPSREMQFDDPENPKMLEDFIRAIGAEPVVYAQRNECCGGYMAVENKAYAACLEAIKAANELGITVSCDLNFRKNLWKYGKSAAEVMPELVAGCDIILGNEEDCEKVFGIRPENFDVTHTNGEVDASGFESVCRQMKNRFPRARKVIITLRGAINANHNTWGGVLLSDNRLYESKRYDITHIVDRVGGGDSFMGGLIYGLNRYPEDDQNALDFAVAASCLKHTIYGDFNLVSVEEVEKLMAGDASGRVSR